MELPDNFRVMVVGRRETVPPVARLIGPGRRLPSEVLAEVFLALVRSSSGLTDPELVDLFLHGAVD